MCIEFISKIQFQHGLMNLMKIWKSKKFKVNFKLNVFLRKKMANYKAADDTIINVEKKFIVEVYNRVFNTIIQIMENRLTNNKEILIDLTLLSPTHFDSFVNGLPKNAFAKLVIKLKPYFDEDNKIKNKLSKEFLSFFKILSTFK